VTSEPLIGFLAFLVQKFWPKSNKLIIHFLAITSCTTNENIKNTFWGGSCLGDDCPT